jgi:lactoylglutathione lyase
MIYRYTILYVADVPEALSFYCAAFGFKTAFLHEAGDYGGLLTGETKLAFSSHALMQQIGKSVATTPPKKPSYELAFETDDFPAALAHALTAGAALVTGVTETPWGHPGLCPNARWHAD